MFSKLFQVVGEAKTGDLCGEIGVLCYRPQLFTVRTKRLCQLLRLNRATFLNIIQANVGDGTIIMNNLLQVYCLYNYPFIIFTSELNTSVGNLSLCFNLLVAD